MKQPRVTSLRVLQVLNVAAFILVIVVNLLANLLPLGGRTTGEVAELYPNLFQPAGYTFSVWILIYFMLGLFVLYQADLLPGVRGGSQLVRNLGWLFVVSSLANAAWLFAWHYDLILLSVLIMVVLLISLILIYRHLRARDVIGVGETLFARVPFSLYLSWISVATIANITVALVSVNWGGLGLPEQFWTIVVIGLALALALLFLLRYRDISYALVTVWALIGILVRHLTTLGGEYRAVIATLIGSLVVLTAALAYRLWRLD